MRPLPSLPPPIAAALARTLKAIQEHDRRVLAGSSPLLTTADRLPPPPPRPVRPGMAKAAPRPAGGSAPRRRSIEDVNTELLGLARTASTPLQSPNGCRYPANQLRVYKSH